ncbi:MAG: glycosyltransferase family 4 protein [Alphaproteobacteria bacterium]
MPTPRRPSAMPPEPRRRRLLMVIESQYPSLMGGGAEAQIETLTRNRPDDLEITVIAPRVPDGPQRIHDVVHGCPVYRIPYPHLRLVGGAVLQLRFAWHLLTRGRGFDAFYCHIGNTMSALACALGRLLDRPVLVKMTGMTELDHGILSENRSLGIAVRRWLIRKASAVQAISETLEKRLIDKGFDPERVHRLPNAVDTGLFAPAAEARPAIKARLGIGAGFVGCFVGRLVPEKALDTLIEAWARAIPSDADAALVLIGAGPEEAALRVRADSLGIAHQMVFPGFVDDKTAIADYWRISDIGLLTSDFEGLSNALLEAMASGVPMIGSAVSGNVDLITPAKTGWLFPPRDVERLSACLEGAFRMPATTRRAMGEAARDSALRAVGVERVWSRILQLCAQNDTVALVKCAES